MNYPLPVQIKLPEKVMLENGTMFVTLRTLDDLRSFWSENKTKFPFSVNQFQSDSVFLGKYEWVFGITKAAVVQTTMRWGESGVGCEFFNWYKAEPDLHEMWFKDRDSVRENAILDGSWTETDQAAYEADCLHRTPESFRGWWRLKNIPGEDDPDEWLSDYQEIIDSNLPIEEVEQLLQEQVFDDWLFADHHSVRAYSTGELDLEIQKRLMEVPQKDSTLRPFLMSITSQPVGVDELDVAAAQRKMESYGAATSPFSALTTAVETIVSELEMMLDDKLDEFAAEIVDAHSLDHLQDAIADAKTALNAICDLGIPGAEVALVVFTEFAGFAAQMEESDVQEIREAYAEVDPQEFLDDYVIKAIANFDELRDAEEDFDLVAHERKALPPAKAD